MHIHLSRSSLSTHLSLLVLSTLASGVAAIGCGGSAPASGSAPELGSAQAALIDEQCEFFDTDGHVQICHHTSSASHPFTIIKTSVQGCINGHAGHALDYIAVGDPTCQGGGCLPETAPCDATLPCCDGSTCVNGTCEAACTLTDLELLDLPNGWKSSGTCGEFKLFVHDSLGTLLDPGVGTGLNIVLAPGTYTFALRGDGFDNNGGSGPTSTLSLFTSCGNAANLAQGSSVTLGSSTVTLTSFSAGRDVVGDVSPCSETPNGGADIAGSVTLQVTFP